MRILLAIPVYNEQKYVTQVLDEVRKHTGDILVIDDGSTDDTPLLLARQPVEVIRHAVNRGYGRSMIDAFRWAGCGALGYHWLITMDCDLQHEPAALPAFFQAIACADRPGPEHADVISGSRYLAPHSGNDQPPPDRQYVNARVTALVNERLGLKLTDAFCGFKAYRVAALKKVSLNEAGYAFPLQFWVQAAAAGLAVRELPVRLIYNDPRRSFGGILDNSENRLAHYLAVFHRELAQFPEKFGAPCSCAGTTDADATGRCLSD